MIPSSEENFNEPTLFFSIKVDGFLGFVNTLPKLISGAKENCKMFVLWLEIIKPLNLQEANL